MNPLFRHVADPTLLSKRGCSLQLPCRLLGTGSFPRRLVPVLARVSRHANELVRAGGDGDGEERCVSRWSDVLWEMSSGSSVNDVDGRKLQNE